MSALSQIPRTVSIELRESKSAYVQQQENFDSFDRDTAMRDYESGMTAMNEADPAAMTGQGSAADDGMQPGQAMNTSSPSAQTLRPRSQMDFAFLDRNSDGQLSVGEYAIWAVRANPAVASSNDGNRPFISTEQLNEAGQTFFFFDEDGDSYLSNTEFMSARNSAMTP